MRDSYLFQDSFSTPQMRAIFADRNQIECYIRVETALARAQAQLGVIPGEAAQAIADTARYDLLDLARLKHDTENVGYPILPLVEQLAEHCGENGGYLHWGATTQDIMDTALILQMRDALDLVVAEIETLRTTLTDMARTHRDTPMAGRTHLQHALPITFGYKAAVWLSMFDRHIERVEQLRPRLEVVAFSGASGTLASLGDRGLDVQAGLAAELGLGEPSISWHTARDALAEAVHWLGLVTASLGKIAQDVMLMMATEFGEVFEPFVPGRGASSTMPQKRNPISCEIICSAAKSVRQHGALMLDASIQDFERATGPWQAEWIAIPESFVLTSGALAQANFALAGLEVDTQRMAANLDMTHGLIVAEAVMMALADHTGRQAAHDIVYSACRRASEQQLPLADALAAEARVTTHLDSQRIAELTDPANYLGQAPSMVDRVINCPR
ncbi:3-carboxy-cis,cis-muconate cycloisomerase [Salinisphaera aquimarina]|uniref:3-carboxy-cis,cis-muconate cycloisomerase n=1 Tax=Salinisphaera aquimarina TaxID=2094031 RepID=A0ABV7EN59_9GAMM